jgi:hypothetical protein
MMKDICIRRHNSTHHKIFNASACRLTIEKLPRVMVDDENAVGNEAA